MRVCMRVCICVYMYVCICMCVYVCVSECLCPWTNFPLISNSPCAFLRLFGIVASMVSSPTTAC